MSTRRSTRIKKVSIRCNGDVDSVSPDLSEGEKTVSVAGVVAIFSNEGEDAEEEALKRMVTMMVTTMAMVNTM